MTLRDDYPPNTLGYDYRLCLILFGETSGAVKFLQVKAEQSPNGWDERFIVPEEQRIQLYAALSRGEG